MRIKGSYIKTPIIILSDSNCSDGEKLVLELIIALSMQKGYCYANNKYFADFLGKKKDTISKIISKLVKKHYIYTKREEDHRRIYLNPTLWEKNTLDIVENSDGSIVEKSDYNTNNYDKKKNTKNNSSIGPILGVDPDGVETWDNKRCVNEPMTEEDEKVFDGLINNIMETIATIKPREE